MPRNLSRNVPLVASRLSGPELLLLASHLRGKPHNRELLKKTLASRYQLTLPAVAGAGESMECAQSLMRIVHAGLHSPSVPEASRRQVRALLDIDAGMTVREHTTTHFTFRFTTDAGGDQVRDPTVDTAGTVTLYNQPAAVLGTMVAGNNVPDYVERIALLMEYAHERFTSAAFGFTNPTPGGRITVTFENTDPYLGWASPDNQISLSRSLSDFYLNDTPIHELFHLFQFTYAVDLGSVDGLFYEGTARLIPDTINERVNRWMSAAWANYAANPNLPLDHMSYDGAAFWKYTIEQLTAQHTPADEPFMGVDVIRRCWELAESTAANCMGGLGTVIEHIAPAGVRFASFTSGPMGLSSNETLLGDWLLANIVKDLANPVSDARFDYLEDEESPDMAQVTRTMVNSLGAMPATVDVNDWAARYLEINLAGLTGGLQFGCTMARSDGLPGAPDGLLQIVLVDSSGAIMDIIKTRAIDYHRHIGLPYGTGAAAHAPAKMLLVMAGLSSGTRFTPTLAQVAAAPDLMITRWNSEGGREYQRNWHDTTFSYRSPDIRVEPVPFVKPWVVGRESIHVSVRVRNKGAAAAMGVRVALSLQASSRLPFPGPLWPWDWDRFEKPLLSPAVDIAANSEVTLTFEVPSKPLAAIPNIKTLKYLTVKATVQHPGDGSADNNEALSRYPIV